MLYVVRRVLFVCIALVVGWLTSLSTDPPPSAPAISSDFHPFFRGAYEGLAVLVAAAFDYPVYVGILALVLLAPMLVGALVSALPRRIHKDPQRLFTVGQKQAGAARAGGRCEMETLIFTRCRRPGEHGDHWLPHSKGGNSTLDNFVWACARHNLAKGAHWPSFWETSRMEWRRRRYFPASAITRPGSKVLV